MSQEFRNIKEKAVGQHQVVIGGVCYIVTGGKIYSKCKNCGKLIRVNKPIFGSMHYCG